MGTDLIRRDGSTNLHFLNRVDAAAQIFFSGKVKHLLVSGNKNNRGYDEVSGIQRALVERGIPESAMILDYEGSRSWETAKRANSIYHLKQVIVVTDSFHAARSIFLCKHQGIDAIAFCPAKERVDYWYFRHRLREYLARIRAVIDVALLT